MRERRWKELWRSKVRLGTNEQRLIDALIMERAMRNQERDSTPTSFSAYYTKAIEELKTEGLIPTTYHA